MNSFTTRQNSRWSYCKPITLIQKPNQLVGLFVIALTKNRADYVLQIALLACFLELLHKKIGAIHPAYQQNQVFICVKQN